MLTKHCHILLCSILCLLFSGCAYYNTFYNAKRDYQEAMKEKDRLPTQQAPVARLDKCIERCGKLIKLHSNSRWVDDAIMLMGKCFYEKAEYQKALRKFEEIIIYYPRSPLLQDAYFMKGQTYLGQSDYIAAVGAFQKAGELEGGLEEESLLRIAECHFESEDYEATVREARRFLAKYPKSKLRVRALKGLGDALFENGNLSEAIAQYEQLLTFKPKRQTLFEVSLRIGAAYLQSDQVERALEILLGLRNKVLDDAERAKLFIWIADCQRALGRYEEAIKSLRGVSDRVPRSEEAQEALYKMGLIYEEDLSDLDEARKSYDQVREVGLSSEYARKALLKSSSIGKLTEYQETLSGGEKSELAKTQFLLAELYLLDLHDQEKALEEYEKVVAHFPESDYGPKAAFAIGWVYENVKKDSEEAITAYQRVISQYPETHYAAASEEAIRRLGLVPDTPGSGSKGKKAPPVDTSSSNEQHPSHTKSGVGE